MKKREFTVTYKKHDVVVTQAYVEGTLSIDLEANKIYFQAYDTRAWTILKTDHMTCIDF